jgi:hypothetical protein
MSGEAVAIVTLASPTMKTLAQLRALAYVPLRDSDQSFFEPWFIDAMLNEGYLDLNARLRLKKQTVTGTADADGLIPLPTDCVEIENLYVGASPASFVDDDSFLSFSMAGIQPYGAGDVGALLARVNVGTMKIETFPVAASADYVLEEIQRPDIMVDETDTPSILTPELLPRIVSYATAKGKWVAGEEQEGAKYMALYEQGLPGAPRDAFRRKPFPLSMIPEAGPYG